MMGLRFGLVFVVLMSSTVFANAATFTVNSNVDSFDMVNGDGLCADGEGLCSFRAAAQESNALAGEDTIEFAFTTPTTINLWLGEVRLTASVTVKGNKDASAILLRGNGMSRVLNIPTNGIAVVISGVTISNGFSGGQRGGGINVESANIKLENVVIQDNVAGSSGGGIYSGSGVLRLIGSVVRNNFAQNNGGGGGLSINGKGSQVVASKVTNNQASRGGGGIEVTGGSTQIVDTSILYNATEGGGGGLLAVFGSADILRSTIANNAAFRSGGGIALPYGTVFLTNSTVSGNRVTNGGGGGINTGENGSIGYLTVVSSTIVNNTASYSGGLTGGYAAGVHIGNTIIANNVAVFGPNILSSFTSNGGNLVNDRSGSTGYVASDLPDGTNALLGPLADNGGLTQTHELLAGSPAINAGRNSNVGNLATDQRGKGFARIVSGQVDIGSYERKTKKNISMTQMEN